jgi:tripartite-type tricarboxylate transporter receptor subunit TctC
LQEKLFMLNLSNLPLHRQRGSSACCPLRDDRATAAPHTDAGKIIPLASAGSDRLGALPHIPTIAESGYPGFNAINGYDFVDSSKVPQLVLDRWNTEWVKAP